MIRRTLIKILASVCAAAGLISCIKDDLGGNGGLPDNKVRLTLYTNSADYSNPVTRADDAGIDPPMVLVFKGHGSSATFEEAVQAVTAAGVTSVTLSKSSAASTILLIANAPDGKFRSGSTDLLFDADNVSTAMEGKTLADVETELRTVLLDSPQASAPFAGSMKLPASGIKEVAKIDDDTKLGETNDKFKLTRAVAKAYVTLDAGVTGYTIQGLGAANAPRNGSLYRQGAAPAVVGAGNTANYINAGEVIPIASAAPLYLYEADKDLGTAIILKLSGRYYKLGFRHQNTPIPVERNKEYNFIVKAVGNGYGTAEEAMTGTESNLIEYEIDVTDGTVHEMVSNGLYYLGLSNSEVAAYMGNEETVTITGAFTITTDAAQHGITSGSIRYPSGVSGPATFNTASPQHIELQVVALPYAGIPVTITVTVGNLALDINLIRYSRMNYGGQLTFYNFLSAEIVDRGEGNWVSGFYDESNELRLDPITLATPSWIQIRGFLNLQNVRKGAVLYSTRAKSDGSLARVKMFIEQDIRPDITPTPVVQGNIPFYVGAFWRNDQSGERLIRIRTEGILYKGEWRASVIEGDDWIVLDNKPSQDPNIWGQGTGEPADMNEAENDSRYRLLNGTQMVGGVMENDVADSIYFRIGLTGTLEEGDPPRYGVVMLEYTYEGSPALTHIYVRQGHEADFLMGPGDPTGPDGWQSATRPAAVRFSPYNLTAEKYWNKNETERHIKLDQRTANSGGGDFTQYPSQAGAYFQWAQLPTATDHLRRAYSPYLPNAGPVDYMSSYSMDNDYWTGSSNLSLTNETCPPGWRRPNHGATDMNVDAINANLQANIGINEMSQSLFFNPPITSLQSVTSDLNNSLWGMYADGHFDRHGFDLVKASGNILSRASVCTGDNRAAYIGRLYYNPVSNASLFFPAAGYRNLNGALSLTTRNGKYWSVSGTSLSGFLQKMGWSLHFTDNESSLTHLSAGYYATVDSSFSIRCIVDE